MAKSSKMPVEEVDEVVDKKARKAAKRAAAEAAAAEEVEAEVDPAEAKKAKKAAKKAAAEAAVAAEVEAEVDPVHAKKATKAAKKAAEAGSAVEAAETISAKKAKKANPVEEPEVDPAEEKKKKKAAKRAAAEALAKAEAGADAENDEAEEAPKKKTKQVLDCEDAPKKAEAPAASSTDFRLFVGGIAWTVDEEMLKKDFSECGEVADIKLLMDKETGSSRGIAFLTMATEDGYKAALKFDGEDYAGRKLNVSKANSDGKGDGKGKDGKGKGKGKDGKGKGKGKGPGPKPAGCISVVVKGLAYSVTEGDLQKVFAKCGDGPTGVKLLKDKETGESRGMGFVDFDDEAAVDEAMKLTGTDLKGRSFFMDYSQPRENSW